MKPIYKLGGCCSLIALSNGFSMQRINTFPTATVHQKLWKKHSRSWAESSCKSLSEFAKERIFPNLCNPFLPEESFEGSEQVMCNVAISRVTRIFLGWDKCCLDFPSPSDCCESHPFPILLASYLIRASGSLHPDCLHSTDSFWVTSQIHLCAAAGLRWACNCHSWVLCYFCSGPILCSLALSSPRTLLQRLVSHAITTSLPE